MKNNNSEEIVSVPARSAGGKARALKLTKNEREAIARAAAHKRWGSPELIQKATFGSPEHPLKIAGKFEIPCYVLEDGTRVLVQTGMIKSLGMSPGGSGGSGGDRVAKFFSGKAVGPFLSQDILNQTVHPIRFKTPNGALAYGYDARILVDICEAILEARDAHALQAQQLHIAKQCEILVRGFAKVGIVALVDEATGYQSVRDREALQQILEKYITDEWAKWTKVFPDEYYKQLFRLKGLPYPYPTRVKPSYIGHWTNDIVYRRLAPGILKSLREKNPRTATGARSRKFHQHLTSDYGSPELKKHLDNVVFLMRACSNWKDFQRLLDKTSPRFGDTMPLDLP